MAPPHQDPLQHRRGLVFGLAAYLAWGLVPIFWNLISQVHPLDMLSYRVLWSLPLLGAVISARRGWPKLRRIYADRRAALIAAGSGLLLSINWGVFIWAVTAGHIVDVSLGYYINPLVSVALAVVVLKESLSPGAKLSVAIATLGVVVMTVSLGVIPWISLVLALSFGFYGLLKKHADAAPPIEGLAGEMAALVLPLGVLLAWRVADGNAATPDPATHVLLACTGIVTVVPLLLFGAAVQRIPLATVGLLQYIAPTIQLALGVFLYGETLAPGQIIGFVTVWVALAIYSIDGLRRARRRS